MGKTKYEKEQPEDGAVQKLQAEVDRLKEELRQREVQETQINQRISHAQAAADTIHESYLRRLTQQTQSTQTMADTVTQILQAMGEISQSYREMLSAIQTVGQVSHNLSDSFQAQSAAQESISSQVESVSAAATSEVKKAQALKGDLNQIQAIRDFMSQSVDSSDEISARLSLLSMNGRIEAAHAGKVGAGFSVVAQEMLRLQQESQSSISAQKNKLQEFLPLMAAMQEKSNAVEAQAQDQKDSIDRITEGSRVIQGQIRQNLGQIDDLTQSIDRLVASIEEGERTIQSTDRQASQVEKTFFEEIFVAKKVNDLDRFIFDLSKRAESLAQASHSIINEYQKISVIKDHKYVWQGESWLVTGKENLPPTVSGRPEAPSWGARVLVCIGQTDNNPAFPQALAPEYGIWDIQPLDVLEKPGHRLRILLPALEAMGLGLSELRDPSRIKNPLEHSSMSCMERFEGELAQTYRNEIARGKLICSFDFGGTLPSGDVMVNHFLSTYQRTRGDAQKFTLLGENLVLSLQGLAESGRLWLK